MFADPEQNVKQFNLTEGMHVADLGAGTGFYSIAAARAVQPSGKVYAVEVQKEMLAHIQNEAAKAHVSNIEILWGNIERVGGTKLADASMDAVIVSNVLFQVEDRKNFVQEVSRILKPGGRVLLIDWSDSFGGMGPAPARLVAKAAAETIFAEAGFSTEREIASGAHHYGIILKKQ